MNSSPSKNKLTMLLAELKHEYLKAFPEKLELLRELIQKEDWSGLEVLYHKLKGTGKTYGFPEISTLCQKMESLSQSKTYQKAEFFQRSLLILEKLNQSYTQGTPYNLNQDPLAQSLLALPLD
jgi:HPt (histidine-containing phosphotransfer) domain-containing protein